MRRILLKVLLVLPILLASQPVMATPSYNGNNLVPTTDNGPYLNTHSTRQLRKYKWTVGTTLNYAHRPLELEGPSGGRVSGVLENLLVMHLLGAFGITDWVQIGLDVPIAIVDRTIDTATGNPSFHTRMSDIRLEAKFRLLDPDNPDYKGWGIAAIPFINFPTGSGTRLVGNKTFAGGAKLAFESPDISDVVRIALNVGYEMRESTILFGTEVDDWFMYSLAANFRVADYFEIVPEIWGKTLAGDMFERESQSPLELGGVFRVFLADKKLALDFGGSGGLMSGVGAPVWRGILRIAYKPLRRDNESQYDLPLPVELTAEDYYLLAQKCPPDPADFDATKHDEACDKLYELRALQGQCPDPEEFDASRHDEACEKIYELQGFDHDGDAVADYLDRCPDQQGPIENDGCPTHGIVVLDWSEGRVKSDKILFEFNSADLTPASRDIVRRIAEQLMAHVDFIQHMTVEGHTDSVGLREYNRVLSVRRAQSVRSALIDYGVPAHKMNAVGFGQSRPAVGNETEEGQQQNRRVEIRFRGSLPDYLGTTQ